MARFLERLFKQGAADAAASCVWSHGQGQDLRFAAGAAGEDQAAGRVDEAEHAGHGQEFGHRLFIPNLAWWEAGGVNRGEGGGVQGRRFDHAGA